MQPPTQAEEPQENPSPGRARMTGEWVGDGKSEKPKVETENKTVSLIKSPKHDGRTDVLGQTPK